MPFLLAKFAYANLAGNFPAANLLNSGVVIYLLLPSIVFSTAVRAIVVVNLLILDILFLTSFILALRSAAVAKLVIVGILFLVSFILALKLVLVAKLVISGILSSISLIVALCTFF